MVGLRKAPYANSHERCLRPRSLRGSSLFRSAHRQSGGSAGSSEGRKRDLLRWSWFAGAVAGRPVRELAGGLASRREFSRVAPSPVPGVPVVWDGPNEGDGHRHRLGKCL